MRERLSFFDTEYTCWEGSLQRSWSESWEYKEVVQIGAVVREGERIIASLDLLIAPTINPILSDYFKTLTGINQVEVDDHGLDLYNALIIFRRFMESFNVYKILSNGGDDEIIKTNLGYHNLEFDFGALKFFDIQPYYKDIFKSRDHVPIERIAKEFNVENIQHNALSDALVLAHTFKLKI